MTTPNSPHLKSNSTPPQPKAAHPAANPPANGAPKDAAEGAAPIPDQQIGDGRHPIGGLNAVCPPDWRTVPTATSWCACGRMRRAVGRRQVVELVADHAAHRQTCPHHPNSQPQQPSNGRRAAA